MRSQLLAAITTNVSTLTQFGVSIELPWEQNAQPLYRKNLKKIYVDSEYKEESTLIPTLDNANVIQDNLFCRAYVCMDAKNPPSQLDNLITNVLKCKDQMGVTNFISESDYIVEKTEDVLFYTFEFRLNTLKT
jgi:hypothetical protein